MILLSKDGQVLLRDYSFLEIKNSSRQIFSIEARNSNDYKIIVLAEYKTKEVAEAVLKAIYYAMKNGVKAFQLPQEILAN